MTASGTRDASSLGMNAKIRNGLLAVLVGLPLFAYTTGGCEDDACLVEGENCTQDYIDTSYGDGRGCCDDMVCEPGPISGVPICQY